MKEMTIGVLARNAGVNIETVRYYQRRGLIATPRKPPGGVRRYPMATLAQLRFIKRAQQLGFSLREIRELLELGAGACAETRALAEARLADIETRLHDLRAMQRTLARLIQSSGTGGAVCRTAACVTGFACCGNVVIGSKDVNSRAIELPASGFPLWFSAEDDMFVVTESLEHPWLIKPRSSHEMPVTIQQDTYQSAPFVKLSDIAVNNETMDRLLDISLQLLHASHITEIVNAVRYMKQQITCGQDSEILQQFGPLWSNSAHELNRSHQPIGR